MGAATHVGQRAENEDAFCLFDLMLGRTQDQPLAILAVADGMGGHASGATASHMAIQAVGSLAEGWGSGDLAGVAQGANEEIWSFSQGRNQRVGTTLTAVVVKPGVAHIAHVGDSRAYLVRGGSINQITEDHSLVGDLLRKGAISEQEARGHEQGNVLHRALGVKEHVEVDILRVSVGPGDTLVLCSDGLTSMVSSQEILQEVLATPSMEDAAASLTSLAVARGGDDNITVVVWRYPGGQSDVRQTVVGAIPVVGAVESRGLRRLLQVLLVVTAALVGVVIGYQVGSLL